VGGSQLPSREWEHFHVARCGGISLLGAGSPAGLHRVMHYGFALWKTCATACPTGWTKKGFTKVSDVVGRSLHRVSDFNHLDLRFCCRANRSAKMHPLQSLLRRLQTTPPTNASTSSLRMAA